MARKRKNNPSSMLIPALVVGGVAIVYLLTRKSAVAAEQVEVAPTPEEAAIVPPPSPNVDVYFEKKAVQLATAGQAVRAQQTVDLAAAHKVAGDKSGGGVFSNITAKKAAYDVVIAQDPYSPESKAAALAKAVLDIQAKRAAKAAAEGKTIA